MARSKPDITNLWAQTGGKSDPGAAKVLTGWIAEIPTYQNFNWLLNRIDSFLANVNDLGIASWDTNTTYDAGSWVNYSGSVYISKVGSNQGNTPAVGANWDDIESYVRALLTELPTSDEKDAMTNASSPDGANPFATIADVPTSVITADEVIHVADEKSSATGPQTLSAATWNTRDLNTTKRNTISGASLSSNAVTLPAGNYYFRGKAPAGATGDHKARLRDTTNSVTLGVGGGMSDTLDSSSNSLVEDYFTLAGTADVELQHYSTGGGGGGTAVGGSEIEVYSELIIYKI